MTNIPSKNIIIMQIFLIFVLPVMLLYFGVLPTSWRIVALALSALLIYGIITREHWTHEEMGVHTNNFKKSLPFYAVFTVLGLVALFLIEHRMNMPDIETRNYLIRTWIFFVPISFFQEFAFRAFLIPRLKELYKNIYVIIFINAILFTLMHIIYPNLGIGLPIAFVSGLFFAWLYMKHPNLLLITISHSILNITAVLLGFFAIH